MPKLGLVLAGGGAKGAYQLGVYKALLETNLWGQVEAVSGTSVGALNAFLFSTTTLEESTSIWKKIQLDDMLKIDPPHMLAKLLSLSLTKNVMDLSHGFFSYNDGLREFIRNNIDYKKIKSCNKDIFLTACSIPRLSPEYFSINKRPFDEIEDILLASSSLPMFVDAIEIQGRQYIDGASRAFFDKSELGDEGDDNIPIKPLDLAGCDTIIAVKLDNAIINHSKYSHIRIIQIQPSAELGSLIDFKKETIEKRINLGYKDALSVLSKLKNGEYRFMQVKDNLEQLRKFL